jgi:hypothetical protein
VGEMSEIKNITIDFDFTHKKRGLLKELFLAQTLLHNTKPCFARPSSSKHGLHVLKFYTDMDSYGDEIFRNYKKFCRPLEWAEEIYDDPKRKIIREFRIIQGMSSGILFDVKCFRDITRVAGDWQFIQDAWKVERFLDFFFDFWRY